MYILEVVESVNVEQLAAGVPEEVHPVGVGLVQLIAMMNMPVHCVPSGGACYVCCTIHTTHHIGNQPC
jgi:hypothetical protein